MGSAASQSSSPNGREHVDQHRLPFIESCYIEERLPGRKTGCWDRCGFSEPNALGLKCRMRNIHQSVLGIPSMLWSNFCIDAIPRMYAGTGRPNGTHDARNINAQGHRQGELNASSPYLSINRVNPCCYDPDLNLFRTRLRFRNIFVPQNVRPAELMNPNCLHV